MQISLRSLTLFLLVLLVGSEPPKDADKQLKILVDRVLKAAGDVSLKEGTGLAWKGTGTVRGTGLDREYQGEWLVAGPQRLRVRAAGTWDDKKQERLLILNGDQGWLQCDGVVDELDRKSLNDELGRAHANWVCLTLPLRDRNARLKILDPRRVDGKWADGMEVSWDARPDVALYFDRQSALLVLSESRFRDPHTGEKVTEEVRYAEYGEFDGVRRATKVDVNWNGKTVSSLRFEDFERVQRVPDGLWARPDGRK